MKYNTKYQPDNNEERKAYFHGQVYSLLRIQEFTNNLKENAKNKQSEEYFGFHSALEIITFALKQGIIDIGLTEHEQRSPEDSREDSIPN